MIKGLHHNAYRCRDSEETRRFYEDFLGLPLAGSLDIRETKSGRQTSVLHTFYQLDDGSYLAFFEAPDMPFEWKAQHDFDLHIALEVEPAVLPEMMARGKAQGIETRGISDHGFVSLDLLSRPERLRDRAHGEDARARADDGSGHQRRSLDSRPLAGGKDARSPARRLTLCRGDRIRSAWQIGGAVTDVW
jgi:catechol 2,3-dioxygenase-like lactoylglutathione lyase family enzyme